MKIIEIFKSIDGEGKRAGIPVIFIRLFGCNLRCKYCDTKYSYDTVDFKEMSIDDILKEVKKLKLNRITLTGGEPLIHKDVDLLIDKLLKNGYELNIETNGAVDLKPFVDKFSKYGEQIFYTVDFKTDCSGEKNKMLLSNFDILEKKDIIKFVIENVDEIIEIKNKKPQIYISPVFNKIDPKDIVNFIIEKMPEAKIQLQLHKFIWDPEERGV